jgi:hypothetical protein
MKQCFSLLLAFSILAPSSFAADTQTSAAPAVAVVPGVPVAAQDKPRVFVTDGPLNGDAASGNVENGPNARVVEIQADLIKVCPKVTVTNRPDTADFTLLFRRDESKRSSMTAFGGAFAGAFGGLAGLALSAGSKVNGASLISANGDLVTATKQRTVEKAILELCASIPATVAHVAPQPDPAQASAQNADMPEPLPIPAPVAQSAPAQPAVAAASTELTLVSTPDGADIEVDGAFVGSTPSTVTVASGDHTVTVSKKGYLPYEKNLRTSGGKINLRADLDATKGDGLARSARR